MKPDHQTPAAAQAQRTVAVFDVHGSSRTGGFTARVLSRADLVHELPLPCSMPADMVITIRRADVPESEADALRDLPGEGTRVRRYGSLHMENPQCHCGSSDPPDEDMRCSRCGAPSF